MVGSHDALETDMVTPINDSNAAYSENMHVFLHHVYEFKKGVRNLILHTTKSEHEATIRERLEREHISYLICPIGHQKINIFFGEDICIDVIKTIGKLYLFDYTDEEDFLLGIMLGYDRKKQCARYLQRKNQCVTEQLIG